ncbi:MAG: hypothetical protein KBS79_05400, partial [Lachnospiraceae bacterium]|nr:hypothetical protein [Candidatus Minthocola equi]
MKKLIALLMAAAMCMSLVACGGNADPTQAPTTEAPTTEAQKDLTPEEKEAAREDIRYAIGLLFDRNY